MKIRGAHLRHAFVAIAMAGLGVEATDLAPPGDIVISEISYNPPSSLGADDKYEFVEIHNRGPATIDLSGWSLKDRDDEHALILPAGTVILAGTDLVLGRNCATLRSTYGAEVPCVGDLPFALGNDGDTVRLFDASGELVDQVTYMDRRPWPVEADGGDATLERISLADDATDFSNFAASVPAGAPGTPGLPNSRAGQIPARHTIVINEIQYNPVRLPDVDSLRHCPSEEFLELYNRGNLAVDISGWSFESGITLSLPQGTVVPAGGFLAVFRDRAQFETKYGAIVNAVGPFEAELDDGGEELLLVDANGNPVDFVDYNDVDPWPVNPDGLKGSLELVDAQSDNDRGRAWRQSVDFKGTPGAENSVTRAFHDVGENDGPQITSVKAAPAEEPERESIRSSDDVRIDARILDRQGVASAMCEYQAMPAGGYIRRTDSKFESDWVAVPMVYDAKRSLYTAVISRQPHRSLVRYRIRATDRAAKSAEAMSPRPEDPEPNFAYYVYDGVPDYVASQRSAFGQPGLAHTDLEKIPVYHVIAAEADIEEAQYKVFPENDERSWQISFVHGGHVHDHVTLQLRSGHRYSWPKRPWKIGFNRGNLFDGRFNDGTAYPRKRKKIHFMSAQHDSGKPRGESGVFESLTWKLYREADVIGASTTFVHLRFVRSPEEHDQFLGDFFGIFLETQRIDSTALEDNGRPSDQESTLYKFNGGPEKVHPDCSLSKADVEAFLAAYNRGQSREWYEKNLDVSRYLSFRVVTELSDNHDMDSLKNFFYYRSSTTQLWEVLPWDVDNTFGADASGDEPLKTRVLPLFPIEYKNRFRFLWQVLYGEDRMFDTIAQWSELIGELADADLDRWDTEPRVACPSWPQTAGGQCKKYAQFRTRMRDLRQWIRGQSRIVQSAFRDPQVPSAPENASPLTGSPAAIPIVLRTTAFEDPDAGDEHSATRWLLIEEGGDWAHPLWDIETQEALTEITAPLEIIAIGSSYLFRAAHRDSTGRWSLLSEPTSFVAGPPDATAPTTPTNLRASQPNSRWVMLEWTPSEDLETGIFGYRILRDGQLLGSRIVASPKFIDLGIAPSVFHAYQVVAVNGAGLESAPSNVEHAPVFPLTALDGWLLPPGGLDYFFDARPGEDGYTAERDEKKAGNLDGTWARSKSDEWDGSPPGKNRGAPGGVELIELPGDAQGPPASVLSLEDGGAASATFPSPSNQRLSLLHAAGDGNLLESGVTLLARLRVNPDPRDLPEPKGQALDSQVARGQIGISQTNLAGEQSFSAWLDAGRLFVSGGESVAVDMLQLQGLWITVEAELGRHRVRVYLNGASVAAINEIVDLETVGVEPYFGGNYLHMGLSNRAEAGAIQIDYFGFAGGAHVPEPAEGATQQPFLRGDADADGKVTLADAVRILDYLFRGERGFTCIDAADVDDQGELEVTDAIVLLRYLFLGGPKLYPPFPDCGFDPTVDKFVPCFHETCKM